MTSPQTLADKVSRTQYQPGQKKGHYESFYLRGNHPTAPQAFWIRYTLFSPLGHPESAIGELWATYFDGETGDHVVAKEEYPLAACHFDRDTFSVQVSDRRLLPGTLTGTCANLENAISWDLAYSGDQPPLYLLPERFYRGSLPKAKSVVTLPLATFHGELIVGGRRFHVEDWVGSINHNWGSRHTDYYAFGQVAGFDDSPETFLELISARVKLGPVSTPMLTPLVLRHRGHEYSLVSLADCFRARGEFGLFHWNFASESDAVRIEGRITAAPTAFVGLNYYNPPGGSKHCLNTKIGFCELRITDRSSGHQEVISTQHRALFEILTDDQNHGVEIRA